MVFDKDPLSIYSKVEKVFIDGKQYFDRDEDLLARPRREAEKKGLLEKEKATEKLEKPRPQPNPPRRTSPPSPWNRSLDSPPNRPDKRPIDKPIAVPPAAPPTTPPAGPPSPPPSGPRSVPPAGAGDKTGDNPNPPADRRPS